MPEEKLVGDWAMEWLKTHVARGLSKNTEDGYRRWICRCFAPWFSSIALNELTEAGIKAFYTELAQEGLFQTSIWCGHLLLRRILDEAGKEGLLEVNPAARITLTPQVKQETMYLRRGQVKRYLEGAEKLGAYPIQYMILTSGLRQGEAISLLWAAFDTNTQRLCLRKRWIQLTPKQMNILVAEHEKHPQSII